MRSRLRQLLACMMALSAPAAAQDAVVGPHDLADPAVRACVAAIRAGSGTLSTVSLALDATEPLTPLRRDVAFELVRDLAARIRARLGAAAGELPFAGSRVRWTGIWATVDVALDPTGLPRIEEPPAWERHAGFDSLTAAGRDLIRSELTALVAAGRRWPFTVRRDSSAFRFRLRYLYPDIVESELPPAIRQARLMQQVFVPVFAQNLPPHRPTEARLLDGVPVRRPRYPDAARQAGATDAFVTEFAVDSSGAPDLASLRVLDGETAGPHRDSFVEAVRSQLATTRFRLGSVGPCPLTPVVRQRARFDDPTARPAR